MAWRPLASKSPAPNADPRDRACARRFFLGLLVYFVAGYYACQWVNARRADHWTLFLPGERAIPFVPAAIFGYTLVYISTVAIYWLVPDAAYFRRMCRAFFWLITVHFGFFLLLPVAMERPVVTGADFFSRVTQWYYLIDRPYNVFPSLHVAFPLLGTICLWPYRRGWGIVYLAMTLSVIVAVVLVKQHYILDAVAAAAVAAAIKTTCRIGGPTSRF